MTNNRHRFSAGYGTGTLLEQLQQHLNLTWLYGDNIRETTGEEILQPMVLPPSTELEKLHELSSAGGIDELDKEITLLVKSDVTLGILKMPIYRLL